MSRARQPGAEPASRGAPEERWEPEIWVREAEAPAPSPAPGARPHHPESAATGRQRRSRSLPADVVDELAGEIGPSRVERLGERLAEAARAYERERYREALRLLKPLAGAAPRSAAVRELHGLTLYRMGRWAEAARELEAFRTLTGGYDQHPALADCYRALGRHRQVKELWEELRHASPSAELMAEGRIVAAGALADRGEVQGGIDLLEKAPAPARQPRDHHLRVWYALADLYERAGDLPRARELFRRVASHDPELYDVAERASALG